MKIFDIHSHVLPCIDDGSRGSDESVKMLCALYSQGVSDVVLTPHFYATENDPDNFFRDRSASADHLFGVLRKRSEELRENGLSVPRIYLGAEVAFFNGMNRAESVRDMCISGTERLLVEMPFDTWSSSVLTELFEFKMRLGITPIIAHIDRHFSCFKDHVLDDLLCAGVEVQLNADAFLSFKTRHRALALLKGGKAHYLGSDCHNMEKRAPNIAEAVETILKKHDGSALDGVIAKGEELALGAKPCFVLG